MRHIALWMISLTIAGCVVDDLGLEQGSAEVGGIVTDPALRPLAKVGGWIGHERFAYVAIADTPEMARILWSENVPDDLAPAEDAGFGLYGDFDAVDLERQAVILWSSGEPVTCPKYLFNIYVDAEGRVAVDERAAGQAECADEYRRYSMVIAVDRERLPPMEAIPMFSLEGVAAGSVIRYWPHDPRNRQSDMDPSVAPLAKANGWRGELIEHYPRNVVEIAYDREQAELAMNEDIFDDLTTRDLLGEPGIYGDLDEVDFEARALVMISSGESSSCPDWITKVETLEDGRVAIDRRVFSESGWCSTDYAPYTLVLAVDRDRLPTRSDLPTTTTGSAVVDAYPARLESD